MGLLFHCAVGERLLAPPFVHRSLPSGSIFKIRSPLVFRAVVIFNFGERIGVLVASSGRRGLFVLSIQPVEEVVDYSRSVFPAEHRKTESATASRSPHVDAGFFQPTEFG